MSWETVVGGLAFPEGARWHDGRLWLSDMHGARVLTVTMDGSAETVTAEVSHPSGLGFLPDGRPLIVSMADRKVMRLDADGPREHADLSKLATWHLNDMAVDPATGRAYVGNFGSAAPPGEPIEPAVLALVEPDGTARAVARDMLFANGMAIAPDGRTLFVAETRADRPRITSFRIQDDGGLADRTTVADFDDVAPDGIALDAEGALWIAAAFTNEVVRMSPDGRIVRRISTGDLGSYGVALGGPDGRDLFVCASPTWLPDEAARLRNGAVLRTRVDVPAP